MSAIRAKNTKPELIVRRYLHAAGLRYRLHPKDLPGRPDIILPKYRTAIFVNGCFWHGHETCGAFKGTTSNSSFWSQKIERNRARDIEKTQSLKELGWKVITVWECHLLDKALDNLLNEIVT